MDWAKSFINYRKRSKIGQGGLGYRNSNRADVGTQLRIPTTNDDDDVADAKMGYAVFFFSMQFLDTRKRGWMIV